MQFYDNSGYPFSLCSTTPQIEYISICTFGGVLLTTSIQLKRTAFDKIYPPKWSIMVCQINTTEAEAGFLGLLFEKVIQYQLPHL